MTNLTDSNSNLPLYISNQLVHTNKGLIINGRNDETKDNHPPNNSCSKYQRKKKDYIGISNNLS